MTPTLAGVLAAVVYGVAIGSFTNVIIDRLPMALDEPNRFGEMWDTRPWPEVLGGRSRCSSCGTPIRVIDNIPIVSYLVLRGRCRGCSDPIPRFHLLVEMLVPALAAVAVWKLGATAALIPTLWLIGPGVAVSVIDVRTLIVPTRIVWPTFFVSVAICVGIAIHRGDGRLLLGGLLGLAVLAGPLFAIWWIHPKGMGFGDVRLAVLIGWNVGFVALLADQRLVAAAILSLLCLVVAAILGIVGGVVLQIGLGRPIPFGPALMGGALTVMILAEPILAPF